MDTEKKVYSTPELDEHGILSEVTKGNGGQAIDGFGGSDTGG